MIILPKKLSTYQFGGSFQSLLISASFVSRYRFEQTTRYYKSKANILVSNYQLIMIIDLTTYIKRKQSQCQFCKIFQLTLIFASFVSTHD